MVEVVVGIALTLIACVLAFAWFGVRVTEDKQKAESEAASLRLGRERRAKADKIMRENVADDVAWRRRVRERLRERRDR